MKHIGEQSALNDEELKKPSNAKVVNHQKIISINMVFTLLYSFKTKTVNNLIWIMTMKTMQKKR